MELTPQGSALLARLRASAGAWSSRLAPTETQRVYLLTILIGIVCGLAAVAFHVAINLASAFGIERALAETGGKQFLLVLMVPLLGGLVTGFFLHYVTPNARGSGIPQVKVAYARRGRVRLRDAFAKFILSTVQIGTGSSLGREGPTVQICAGVATALGRAIGVSPQNQRRLLPVGAAAGIAAAFNAPIAAVTFTVEEIVGHLDQTVLSGVIVAAAVAAVVERSVLGTHTVFSFRETPGLDGAASLFFYALLGLLAAMVAVLFTDMLLAARTAFRRQKRVPSWAQPGVGALITGVFALLAIYFVHTTGITGGGYVTLGQALNGRLAVKVLVVLGALKLMATVCSYSSGGAGGVFAPTLFMGAMLGGTVGALDMWVLHHGPSAMGAFALVGMGAVFAGVIRAPITSVLIIIEITSGYSLALPLMIANMTAYALSRHWRPIGIYEALLAQDGIHLDQRAVGTTDVLLESVLPESQDFVSLSTSMNARELIAAATDSSQQQVFPVVDERQRLVGLITLDDVTYLAAETELDLLVTASDIMHRPISLRPSDDLHSAFESMVSNNSRELPIVDGDGHVIAVVDESTIARAYLGVRRRVSAASELAR